MKQTPVVLISLFQVIGLLPLFATSQHGGGGNSSHCRTESATRDWCGAKKGESVIVCQQPEEYNDSKAKNYNTPMKTYSIAKKDGTSLGHSAIASDGTGRADCDDPKAQKEQAEKDSTPAKD